MKQRSVRRTHPAGHVREDLLETACTRFRAALDQFSANPTVEAFREVQREGNALDEVRRAGSWRELNLEAERLTA
jgi:hypothetical protein